MLELGILELIRFAREHSPFYQNLYASLPDRDLELTELPVIDQSSFWRANTLKDNQILTGPIRDGIVFKSGGTTGSPKFSVFSKTEWEIFTDAFGKGIGKGGLRFSLYYKID
jgi:phenylacetate-CoA ligase